MPGRNLLLVLAMSMASMASGQVVPTATGTVVGRVICSDTQQPARMAHVFLQPLVDLNSPVLHPEQADRAQEQSVVLIPTLIDGSFVIPKVAPGKYYIFAEQDGYVSPLSQFSRAELNHPDQKMLGRIANLMTAVSVTAGHTSQADVRLLRGAVITGTVHFDDGSPSIRTPITLLHKSREGKWEQVRVGALADGFGGLTTDDRGGYRVAGLATGDYLLRASLLRDEITVGHVFDTQGSMSSGREYVLYFFPGEAMRPKDAKAVHAEEGTEAAGVDIEIPISKLYSLTGTISQKGTARTMNAGHVALVYADDEQTEVTSTDVSGEDGHFHFLYVPAGNFVLKATNVRDVTRTEVPNCDRCIPPTHTEEKTLRSYADAIEPVLIQSDQTGVVIPTTTQDVKH